MNDNWACEVVRQAMFSSDRPPEEMYLRGYVDALYTFAIWKDGISTIGCRGERPCELAEELWAEYDKSQGQKGERFEKEQERKENQATIETVKEEKAEETKDDVVVNDVVWPDKIITVISRP